MSDFKVITYKKKNKNIIKTNKVKVLEHLPTENKVYAPLSLIERIKSSKEEIFSSVFYEKLIQSLRQSGKNLENIDIVSLGLGQFSQCVSSRYQFAFLLALKELFKARVFAYDPVFKSEEVTILNYFCCSVIEANEEGKRKVDQDTIFFLPHCPKQIINNLLWTNWNVNLNYCILISNSFEKILESHADRFLKENIFYVFNASQFVTEIKIDNCFKFSDIFNDLSIHFFLKEDIESADKAILNSNTEPIYLEDDIEFVRSTLVNNLSIN